VNDGEKRGKVGLLKLPYYATDKPSYEHTPPPLQRRYAVGASRRRNSGGSK